jgi:hypothetical protein
MANEDKFKSYIKRWAEDFFDMGIIEINEQLFHALMKGGMCYCGVPVEKNVEKYERLATQALSEDYDAEVYYVQCDPSFGKPKIFTLAYCI